MPAVVARGAMWVALLSVASAALARGQGQGGDRLRKTDLVRLLADGTLASEALAALVRRNCLSFTPTTRDRADLTALGADSAVLREIDACTRRDSASALPRPAVPAARAAAGSRAPPAPPRVAPNRATDAAQPAPPRLEPSPVRRPAPSATRTDFVHGAGQQGVVGSRAARPLVFEVRDAAGVPLRGEAVTLAVVNGRLGVTRAVTDASGRVQVDLVFGPLAGSTVVTAVAGPIERRATLYAAAGPAAKLLLSCGAAAIDRKVVLAPGAPAALRVTAQDAFANAVPLLNLQVAVGDRGVVRVASVGSDSLGGVVSLKPGETGSTSLVVMASGQREDLTVTVQGLTIPSPARCP